MERGERQHALVPLERRLQHGHSAGEHEGGRRAERNCADEGQRDAVGQAHHAHGRALHDDPVADVRDVVVTACHLQHDQTRRTAPTPNSAMSRPNCVSEASRTSRTYTTPSEKSDPRASTIAAVGVITMRTSGIRSASRNRAGCSSLEGETSSTDLGSRETKRNDTTKVSASTKKTSTYGCPPSQPPDGDSRATAPKAAAPNGIDPYDDDEDRRVRDRQLVAFDQIGDERVTGGKEHDARGFEQERADVHPPQVGHQRYGDDDPDPHQVSSLHRAAPIPAPHTAGGERARPLRQEAGGAARRHRRRSRTRTAAARGP